MVDTDLEYMQCLGNKKKLSHRYGFQGYRGLRVLTDVEDLRWEDSWRMTSRKQQAPRAHSASHTRPYTPVHPLHGPRLEPSTSYTLDPSSRSGQRKLQSRVEHPSQALPAAYRNLPSHRSTNWFTPSVKGTPNRSKGMNPSWGVGQHDSKSPYSQAPYRSPRMMPRPSSAEPNHRKQQQPATTPREPLQLVSPFTFDAAQHLYSTPQQHSRPRTAQSSHSSARPSHTPRSHSVTRSSRSDRPEDEDEDEQEYPTPRFRSPYNPHVQPYLSRSRPQSAQPYQARPERPQSAQSYYQAAPERPQSAQGARSPGPPRPQSAQGYCQPRGQPPQTDPEPRVQYERPQASPGRAAQARPQSAHSLSSSKGRSTASLTAGLASKRPTFYMRAVYKSRKSPPRYQDINAKLSKMQSPPRSRPDSPEEPSSPAPSPSAGKPQQRAQQQPPRPASATLVRRSSPSAGAPGAAASPRAAPAQRPQSAHVSRKPPAPVDEPLPRSSSSLNMSDGRGSPGCAAREPESPPPGRHAPQDADATFFAPTPTSPSPEPSELNFQSVQEGEDTSVSALEVAIKKAERERLRLEELLAKQAAIAKPAAATHAPVHQPQTADQNHVDLDISLDTMQVQERGGREANDQDPTYFDLVHPSHTAVNKRTHEMEGEVGPEQRSTQGLIRPQSTTHAREMVVEQQVRPQAVEAQRAEPRGERQKDAAEGGNDDVSIQEKLNLTPEMLEALTKYVDKKVQDEHKKFVLEKHQEKIDEALDGLEHMRAPSMDKVADYRRLIEAGAYNNYEELATMSVAIARKLTEVVVYEEERNKVVNSVVDIVKQTKDNL